MTATTTTSHAELLRGRAAAERERARAYRQEAHDHPLDDPRRATAFASARSADLRARDLTERAIAARVGPVRPAQAP